MKSLLRSCPEQDRVRSDDIFIPNLWKHEVEECPNKKHSECKILLTQWNEVYNKYSITCLLANSCFNRPSDNWCTTAKISVGIFILDAGIKIAAIHVDRILFKLYQKYLEHWIQDSFWKFPDMIIWTKIQRKKLTFSRFFGHPILGLKRSSTNFQWCNFFG